MANQWFKFYGGDYLSDPKIERLSPLERSCWVTILCMASMGTDGTIEFLTVESLLNRSGIQFDPYHPEEWEKALAVLVKFKNLKMIDTTDDGKIVVINWGKRQEHNLTVAERVAKSRRNKLNVTTNVTNVTTEENRIEESRIEDTPPRAARREKAGVSYSPLGAEILKAFEEVDAKNKNYYGNKTQRRACDFLLEEHGLETTLKAIKILPAVNRKKLYIGQVTTPYELQEKWEKIKNALEQEKSIKSANVAFV